MELTTILWREYRFFIHRFMKITTSQLVTPCLYLLTFGLGFNHVSVEGHSYLYFLIPGLISMTTMRNSYSSISMRISVARLHEKSFETYIYAPTNMVYITLGYILTGALRGLYAGVFVFLMAALVGGYTFNLMLLLVVFLNCIIFSSLGFIASVKIDTHYDLNRFATLVITPMSFLCGTLYSVGNLPIYYKWFIEMLPLTHTTRLIRRSMLGYGIDEFSLIVTIFYIVILSMISFTLLNETYDI